jgi:hypothetical protein
VFFKNVRGLYVFCVCVVGLDQEGGPDQKTAIVVRNVSKNILRERFVNNFYCDRTKIAQCSLRRMIYYFLTDIRQNRPEFALTGTQEIFSGFVIDSGT